MASSSHAPLRGPCVQGGPRQEEQLPKSFKKWSVFVQRVVTQPINKIQELSSLNISFSNEI